MVPVPPCKLCQPVGNSFRKPPSDRPRRISRDDGVSGDVLGHDGACAITAPAPTLRPGNTMAPCPIQTSWPIWTRCRAPFEEFGLVPLFREIRAGAIGEVRLRGPVHRMIARIDPRHRRNRAELSDRGVGDLGIVDDIGIIVHRHVVQDRARANLAIGASLLSCSFALESIVGSTESILPAMRTSTNDENRSLGMHVIDAVDVNVMTDR